MMFQNLLLLGWSNISCSYFFHACKTKVVISENRVAWVFVCKSFQLLFWIHSHLDLNRNFTCTKQFLPDTNVLVLVSKMLAPVPVVCLDQPTGASKMILGAALGGKIVVIAVVLCHLDGPWPGNSTGPFHQVESKLVAKVRCIDVHWNNSSSFFYTILGWKEVATYCDPLCFGHKLWVEGWSQVLLL